MKSAFLATALGCLLAVVSLSHAQTAPASLSELQELQKDVLAGAEKVGQPTKAPTEEDRNYSRYRMEEESNRLILALSVMGAGILSLFLVLAYLKRKEAGPDSVVTGSGLVLVIFATVLIVILVKRDEQLTAATGILGAIAGYLFGKATKGSRSEQELGKTPTTM
jgi:hypothetical protein